MNTQKKNQPSVERCGSLRLSVLARLWALLVVTTGLVSSAGIIAQWNFAEGNPLADSSGNGHNLTNPGNLIWTSAAPAGSGLEGSYAFTNAGLVTAAALDLSQCNASGLRISWWQLVKNDAVGVVFQDGDRNTAGRVLVATNLGDDANNNVPGRAQALLNNAQHPSLESFDIAYGAANTTWQKFTVEYNLLATSPNDIIKVSRGLPASATPVA